MTHHVKAHPTRSTDDFKAIKDSIATSLYNQASSNDPLVAIAREIKELSDRYEHLERMEFDLRKSANTDDLKHSARKSYLDAEIAQVFDLADAKHDALSTMQATSLEAAAVQIGEAYRLASMLLDGVGERDYQSRSMEMRFERLIYSALSALQKASNLDFDTTNIAESVGQYRNPWLTHEECLAIIGG
jgi:hypothetical protein